MAAAAHTPGGYGGVPQSVGREFNQADKGSKLLSDAMRHRADGGIGAETENEVLERDRREYGGLMLGRSRTDQSDQDADPRMNRFTPGIGARTGDTFMVIDDETKQGNPDREHLGFGGIGKTPSIHIPRMPASKPPQMGISTETPWWTRSEARGMTASPAGGIGMAHPHMAIGGMSMSMESPWWERSDARIMDMPMSSGLIPGSGAGRTDRIPLAVPSESHIVPSDVVSTLGQNTTAHGGRVLEGALATRGPWGVPYPKEIKGHGPPSAPHLGHSQVAGMAEGGGRHSEKTSILAASGEAIVPPWDVEALGERGLRAGMGKRGQSAMELGHELIDQMIKRAREYQIRWLKKAPAPKK